MEGVARSGSSFQRTSRQRLRICTDFVRAAFCSAGSGRPSGSTSALAYFRIVTTLRPSNHRRNPFGFEVSHPVLRPARGLSGIRMYDPGLAASATAGTMSRWNWKSSA